MRVSLVASATSVTWESVRAPPDASVTVPVMPPRVCWERAVGTRSNDREQTRKDVARVTELRNDFDIRRRLHRYSSHTCARRQLEVDLHRFQMKLIAPINPGHAKNCWV